MKMSDNIHRNYFFVDNKQQIMKATNSWTNTSEALPTEEGYYEVKFSNGQTDEKPFRIRPSKNIKGFMTEEKVIQWRKLYN